MARTHTHTHYCKFDKFPSQLMMHQNFAMVDAMPTPSKFTSCHGWIKTSTRFWRSKNMFLFHTHFYEKSYRQLPNCQLYLPCIYFKIISQCRVLRSRTDQERINMAETYNLVTISIHDIRKSLWTRPSPHDCFIAVSNQFWKSPGFLPLPFELQ